MRRTFRNGAAHLPRRLARWLPGALACIYLPLCLPAQDLPGFVWLHNECSFPRQSEVIKITRSELNAGETTRVPLFLRRGKILPSQLIREEAGGAWAAVLVQVTMPPRSSQKLRLRWVMPEQLPKLHDATDVLLSLRSTNGQPNPAIITETRDRGFTQNIEEPKYQLEGPGIENDKFVLRVFFDHRNGRDLYGKLVASPVISQIGLTGSWHALQSWGMDILKTGNSLGAGGLAVEQNGGIYRLADADSSNFHALYDGPLQAAFQLTYTNWDVGAAHGNGTDTLSINAGNFVLEDNLALPLHQGQSLIVGLPDFYPSVHTKHTVHNAQISSISTYGPQAEGTGTKLGLAVFFPTTSFRKEATTSATDSTIPNSYYAVLEQPAQVHRLALAVCWEKTDARFSTEAGFESYLSRQAEILAHPILVSTSAQPQKGK
jgi:hypothetical protein